MSRVLRTSISVHKGGDQKLAVLMVIRGCAAVAFHAMAPDQGVNVRKWEESGVRGGDNYLDVLRISEPRSGGT